MDTRQDPIEFVIPGEPVSKANSRRLVVFGGKPRFIKSKKGMAYFETARSQAPELDPLFEQDVRVIAALYYASNRPDLDESLLLDALQGRVYRNDRQVREKLITHGIDRQFPRAEVRVEPLESSG